MNSGVFVAEIATLSEQLIAVLRQLQPHQYVEANPHFQFASVGDHVRHIISFFDCLQEIHHQDVVNYDLRIRDCAEAESIDAAVNRLENMAFLAANLPHRSIRIAGKTMDDFSLQSETARELLYHVEHTIHHMAMIRSMIQTSGWDVWFPSSFGLAYATPSKVQM